jgi:hypothetical protein
MANRADWQDVLHEDIAASSRNAIVGGPFGSDLVSSDYSSAGTPVIRGENLSLGRWVGGDFVFVPPAKAQQLSANTAGPLDIVFTQRGANHYRQVAVVPKSANGRFVISQSQMKLTVDLKKADPLFVYYSFEHRSSRNICSGTQYKQAFHIRTCQSFGGRRYRYHGCRCNELSYKCSAHSTTKSNSTSV